MISGLLDQGLTLLDFSDDSDNAEVDGAGAWIQPASILLKNGTPVDPPTTVANGDELEIEVVAPYDYAKTVTTTLTVGNRTEQWTVTTPTYGATVAEGSIAEPWEMIGAFYLGEFPGSVDNTNSYYIMQVPSSYHVYIRNMSADVDLFVYSTADFATTLLCSSTNAGTADEACEGVGLGEDINVYVLVDGSKTPSGALFELTTEP